MKQPLFSIATPCYNSAKTIERTMKSVLAQEFKDYEYIIVDGGSTDGTLDIIKQYEPLFEGRMHWKSEHDKGLYDAFNKGIERSTGVYCWNVNSDDYIEHDSLTIVSKIINSQNWNKLPIIIGALNIRLETGEYLKTIYNDQESINRIYKNNSMVNHPSMIIPRQVYQEFGMYDTRFRIAADKDFFHRIYPKYPYFEVTDVVLSNLFRGGVSNQLKYCMELSDQLLFLKKKYHNPIFVLFYLLKWHKYFWNKKQLNKKELSKFK